MFDRCRIPPDLNSGLGRIQGISRADLEQIKARLDSLSADAEKLSALACDGMTAMAIIRLQGEAMRLSCEWIHAQIVKSQRGDHEATLPDMHTVVPKTAAAILRELETMMRWARAMERAPERFEADIKWMAVERSSEIAATCNLIWLFLSADSDS